VNRWCFLLSFLSFAVAPFVNAQTKVTLHNNISETTLHTQGTAVLSVPADQVTLNVGALTEHADAKIAIRENNEILQKCIKAIEALGIKKGEYQTAAFSVRPKYSSHKFNGSSIEGYTVTNTIDIKTRKLDLVGEIINGVTSAGGNQVNSIVFGLEDLRVHRDKVIAQATMHAKEDAEILASSSSLSIKRILSVEVDDAYGSAVNHRPRFDYAISRSMEGGALPPIEAGDSTIRATVKIIYEVGSAQ
jgi:uncharacterized protein YggE